MKALPLLLVIVSLAVLPVGSLAQEPTEALLSLHSEEAQNTSTQTTTPAQTQASTSPQAQPQGPPPNLVNTIEAVEPMPRRDLVHWNEYQGPHFTIRVGAGLLYDFAAFTLSEKPS
jgi:hypothetical protein